jgi:DNA polymerase-3 subunit delta
MQLKPEQLHAQLHRKLSPVYLISGDEPQQLGELADAIRAAAKTQEYAHREVLVADKVFEWSQLNQSADNLSIFADKKIIDLRMQTGSPGTDGAKAIVKYCQELPDDNILLITAGKIKKESQKSVWFQAIDKVGAIVQVWPLVGHEFNKWLHAKLQQRGLSADNQAVQFLADKVEGNLLAAAQEIEKLYVLYGAGNITLPQIKEVVADNSRYDVFQWVESVLARHGNKLVKILYSLKDEGVSETLLLWAIAREIRLLIHIKAVQTQQEKELLLKKNAVWGERKQLILSAAKRLPMTELNKVLSLSAATDRQIKGQQRGDAWHTLEAIGLKLAGFKVL